MVCAECVQLRSQLQVQLGSLQVDYESAVQRAEEESEASTQLRAQVSRLNSELAALKGKYDRELLQKSEEFEEYKCALSFNVQYSLVQTVQCSLIYIS